MSLRISVLLLLGLNGCKEDGPERYAQALAQYQKCVDQGATPSDPRCVEVFKLLDAVPENSSERGRADLLRSALQRAQAPKLRQSPVDAGSTRW